MTVRGHVRFILDGEVVELDNLAPTRTVLQFLREDLVRPGTKEGCAEGDCGACTVVLIELDDSGEDLAVRPVNACIQFVATLDGKELLTVESLASAENGLHPVQQAMVEEHGSQCGFCTPGFVMSLFALFKNDPAPDRVAIDDALAGNLCRCTGYRPIVAAASRMYDLADQRSWLTASARQEADSSSRRERLLALQDEQDLVVGDASGRFMAPATIESLASAVAENPDATILAGGTDIGLWVTKQHRDLELIIYTGRVRELACTRVTDTAIEFGAAATLATAAPLLLEYYPDFTELFQRWASPPIRNAATLAGNVANGSPIGDSMPPLMAIGAEVVLRRKERRRSLRLEDLYIDYQELDLRAGEFVEMIRVPLPAPRQLTRAYKVSKRFDQDISAVCLGASFELDRGIARNVRLAFGGMAATIRRARSAERALEGRAFDDASVAAAMAAVENDFEPLSDMRASADYRRAVCRNLIKRLQLDVSGDFNSVYRFGRAS